MGNKYGLFMIESLVVGSILGCTARFVDWTGVNWSAVGTIAAGTIYAILGLAALGLLGLIAFTIGAGWVLLLKSVLRRLRAN
jgi:hypothetical protein